MFSRDSNPTSQILENLKPSSALSLQIFFVTSIFNEIYVLRKDALRDEFRRCAEAAKVNFGYKEIYVLRKMRCATSFSAAPKPRR